jgi:hypothetical protein
MSAPGIQLSSQPLVTYFRPTIRQYLQGIKDAVALNNLPAARQAFAQLTKAVPSAAQRTSAQASELPTRVAQNMQALGSALEAGDHSAVQQAVAELRANLQSMSDEQGQQRQSAAAEPVAASGSEGAHADGSISEAGPNLSVKA